MLSHTRHLNHSSAKIYLPLKQPSDFTSEKEFLEYLQTLPLETVCKEDTEELVNVFFNMGLTAVNEENKEQAEKLWQRAAQLGSGVAALNLAGLMLDNNQINKAIFWAKDALYLSSNSDAPNTIRSAAHLMLAQAEFLKSNNTYHSVLKIISHLRKAMKYDPSNFDAETNYQTTLETLQETDKERLLDDSTLFVLESGIIKTAAEMFSKPNITPAELEVFLTYPDPKRSPTFKKLGIFYYSGEVSGKPETELAYQNKK